MRQIAFVLMALLAFASPARAGSAAREAAKGDAALNRVIACLFERDQAKIATLLISWPGSPLEQNTIGAMERRAGICMPANSRLSFPSTLMRAMLAEHALLRQFTAPAPLPALPAGWASEPLGNTLVPSLGALHGFGRCVVLAAPDRADALARTARGSVEESAAIDGLRPALAGCITANQRFALDRAGLRGLLAEALLAALNRGEGAPTAATLHAIYWPPRG